MKLIINADGYGMTRTVNQAVVDGFQNGILTGTSILPNMPAFEDAIRKLKLIEGIGLGIQLNIVEYKSKLRTKEKHSKLYDKDGRFNNNFFKILLKSNDEDFMFEVEHEFRSQIEAVIKYFKPDHLNSLHHVHSIPKIFNLVCKLAKEYNIPAVRTENEKFYLTDRFKDKSQWQNWLNQKIYLNYAKTELLRYFSDINRQTIKEYSLNTNDLTIGLRYKGMLDSEAIKTAIEEVKETNGIVELIYHPDLNEKNLANLIEYKAICSSEMSEYLKNIETTNYRALFLKEPALT